MNTVSASDSSSILNKQLIEDPSQGGGGRWENTATKAGSSLDRAEKNLVDAFSFTDEKNPKFKTLLKQLGLNAQTTLHGLQMIVQMRYDKAKQLFTSLSQILSGKHEVEQRVIDKIGR